MSGWFKAVKVPVRHFSSALYITGDKASKHFAVLTPIIEFEKQLQNKDVLFENIKLRNLPIDLNAVEERWNFFKDVEERKNSLEHTRVEIGKRLASLIKLPEDPEISHEIEKIRLHLKVVKEDLKDLKNMTYNVEEGAVLQVLGLPNALHAKTPKTEELELYQYLECPEHKTSSHIEIAEERNLIKNINSFSCYLKSEAALFEYAVQNYFVEELLNLNYLAFSNSDFVKSVVVEGCGTNPFSSSKVLTLENIHCINSDDLNRLHLVGGSSLYSFMAYFTKHFVQHNHFPLKVFGVGRYYRAVNKEMSTNLFNLNQTSEIGLFHALLENSDIFDELVNNITLLYKQLGFHFRVVLVPASQLSTAESLRISVQMFSNYLLSYVEVGHVSFYQDYLSKRLLFNYSKNKERKYPHVIGGSLINIHRVIGCLLENNSVDKKPLLNEFLSKYI